MSLFSAQAFKEEAAATIGNVRLLKRALDESKGGKLAREARKELQRALRQVRGQRAKLEGYLRSSDLTDGDVQTCRDQIQVLLLLESELAPDSMEGDAREIG
jgi:hypothetical protein